MPHSFNPRPGNCRLQSVLLAAVSASDAVHSHLQRVPEKLRALKTLHQWQPSPVTLRLAKVFQCVERDGVARPQSQRPSKAALHGGALFIAGVVLTTCVQLLQRLQDLQHYHEGGSTSGTTKRQRRRFAPWRSFGNRLGNNKEHANIPRNAHGLAEKALEHQKAFDPQGAIPYLEQALEHNPGNVDLLALIAKQWSDSSFLDDWPVNQRLPANEKALMYSQQAVEAEPNNAMGYVVACMSKGRLAYWTHDNKQKILWAKQAQDDVMVALQLDPSNDLAHHLMGRWHYEMAQLNFVVRSLVRVLYGATLIPGSVPDALESYKKAAELNPRRLVHRVEVGRMHERLGQHEEALTHLKAALELEVEDINSRINRQEAVEMIQQLERKLRHGRPAEVAGEGSSASSARLPFLLPRPPWSVLALPVVPVEA